MVRMERRRVLLAALVVAVIWCGPGNSAVDSRDDRRTEMEAGGATAAYKVMQPIGMRELTAIGEEMDSSDRDSPSRELHKKGGPALVVPPPVAPVVRIQAPSVAVPPMPPPMMPVRVEVQRIVKEKSCPPGMDLHGGDRCVGLETLPSYSVCPPQFVMASDGECIARTRPLVDCPAGYEFRSGRCFSCEILQAEFVCQHPGEELDASGAACVSLIESPPTCPAGFSVAGGMHNQCIQRLPGQYQCPAGMSLAPRRGAECVLESVMPATIVCPEGSSLDAGGHRCVAVRQPPPQCPRGFQFDARLGSCIQFVPQVPADCPPGFRRVVGGGMCERIERYPHDVFCPEGFQLAPGGEQCIREVPVPPRCPNGYFMAPGAAGECHRVVPEEASCPVGSRPVGSGMRKQCQEPVSHEVIECCPPGFEPSSNNPGKCERVERLVPELSCENECFRVFSSPLAFACPDDTTYRDDLVQPKCVRRVSTMDCPAVDESRPRCLSSQATGGASDGDASTGGSALRAMHHYGDPGCISSPVPECRESFHEEEILAQPYCPEGGVVEGRQCVAREPIVPERVCRMGELDPLSGDCIRRTVVPLKSDCPPGTQRDPAGRRCISYVVHEPILSCPANAFRGNNECCVLSAPAVSMPPQLMRAPVGRRCLTGELTPAGDCAHIERVQIDMTCPAGARQDATRCVVEAEMVIPPPIEKVVRASLVCPDGRPAVNGNCRLVDTAPASFVCPPGAESLNQGVGAPTSGALAGMCAIFAERIARPPRTVTSPARPTCPNGATQRGSTCVVTHETEALRACPSGFQLSPGGHECIQTAPPASACPSGSVLSSQSPALCEREVFATPTTRIVHGCIHNVADACTGCPRDVVSVCHRNG